MKVLFALALAGAGAALAQWRNGESDPAVCPPATIDFHVKVCYLNKCAQRYNCTVGRPCYGHPYIYTEGEC